MKSVRRTAWGVPALLLVLPALASAATITVNSTSDAASNDGSCTLREAITSANTNTASGALMDECGAGQAPLIVDVIAFSVAGTIIPASPLPTIIEPVVINGFTAPGASANTLAVGNDSVHVVEINGTNAGLGMSGFTVTMAGGGTTIQGLVINRFVEDGSGNGGHGILLSQSSGNTITGNFIGTNTAGTAALANQGIAVRALAGANNNVIGGTTPASRNVLSGNDVGVQFGNSANGNAVRGNYIGVNASGTAAITNIIGVQISGSASNTIGGSTAAARNIISGNTVSGVDITNAGATNNLIQGNFIGTDVTGALAIGNGADGGIRITDGFSGPAVGNQIGGAIAGEGNVIAFNTGDGVSVTALSGFINTAISILGNSIHSNGGLGIDLGDNGVTPNDTDDPDLGHNGLQNFPVITSVVPGVGITTINGTLNSNALTVFRLQFFSNTACDPSGNGEGQTFLGEPTPAIVTTQLSTTVPFSVTVPTVVTNGQVITATATDIGIFDKRGVKTVGGIRPMGTGVIFGETSEFSACFVVGGATPTPTTTPSVTLTPTSGPSPTPTLTPSNTPTLTPSNTPTTTFTPTSGPSPTPTNTPTTTFTPTSGPSPTPTLTPSNTPTLTPSNTPTTTLTPTEGPSPTPTSTPSNTPIIKQTLTPTPTLTPSFTPTSTPTAPVGATETPTTTPTTVPPSATPTLVGGGGGPPGSIPVPTLSEGMLALLAIVLAGLGYLLIRRS